MTTSSAAAAWSVARAVNDRALEGRRSSLFGTDFIDSFFSCSVNRPTEWLASCDRSIR
jgi:hypothetical protein